MSFIKRTPLHWAVYRGHEEIVVMLLSNGANPDLLNSKGQKPSDLAQTKELKKLLSGEFLFNCMESMVIQCFTTSIIFFIYLMF